MKVSWKSTLCSIMHITFGNYNLGSTLNSTEYSKSSMNLNMRKSDVIRICANDLWWAAQLSCSSFCPLCESKITVEFWDNYKYTHDKKGGIWNLCDGYGEKTAKHNFFF